jgi:hypothetical protein
MTSAMQYLLWPATARPQDKYTLLAMVRIFGYLKYHKKHCITMDPTKPTVDQLKIIKHDLQELYPGLVEELPPNMLEPKGKS